MALNERQKRFVEEYLIDLNATQAAIRAGYSAKTATQHASRLLTDVNVRSAISVGQKSLSERAEISQERVVKELAKIGFSDIRKAVKWSATMDVVEVGDAVMMTNGVLLVDSEELDDDTAAAISEISQTAQGVKIKLHDKRAALVDIGRHLGMFKDKVELSGKLSLEKLVADDYDGS